MASGNIGWYAKVTTLAGEERLVRADTCAMVVTSPTYLPPETPLLLRCDTGTIPPSEPVEFSNENTMTAGNMLNFFNASEVLYPGNSGYYGPIFPVDSTSFGQFVLLNADAVRDLRPGPLVLGEPTTFVTTRSMNPAYAVFHVFDTPESIAIALFNLTRPGG